MICNHKNIGTFAPLFALWSRKPELKHDNGTLGMAPAFLAWLSETGQNMWQLLPLAETHLEPGSTRRQVPSPYKGYGVGLSPRWLPREYSRMMPSEKEMQKFLHENRDWLSDYAFFCALRDHFGTDDWTEWPSPVKCCQPEALGKWRERLSDEISHHVIVQWQLAKAYESVRREARTRKIHLIGDLPFYVPLQSPLVWANQQAFRLGRGGKLTWQSGIPIHATGHFGRQVWGHPLYNWSNYHLVMNVWKIRLDQFADHYDMVRIDHPKGFYRFGAMHTRDSSKDRLSSGPGSRALLSVVRHARSKGMEVVAEDAGYRLEDLRRALKQSQVAGIRMLRFGYNERQKRIIPRYADISRYPSRSVAYPSTHDTESMVGYLKKLRMDERRMLAERVGVEYASDVKELAVNFVRAVIESPARCVMVPIRDWLGSSRRLNLPGTEKPVGDRNWRYRTEVPIEEFPDLKNFFS